MRRLRKAYPDNKIRFYMCGEYGSNLGRPHFHGAIFGLEFADKTLWSIRNDQRLYTSKTLEDIWGKGFVVIGDVTFESAAYIARYITKKILGKNAEDHYIKVDETTGEIHNVLPEYTGMSLKPGIAAEYYKKYKEEIYFNDSIILNGRVMNPPRYYDKLLERENPTLLETIKVKRKEDAQQYKHNNTKRRLQDRETCKKSQLKHLPRHIEEL